MPYAIAIPAAILARGARNNTISPSAINIAPSQLVRSALRASIHFLIVDIGNPPTSIYHKHSPQHRLLVDSSSPRMRTTNLTYREANVAF